VSYRWNAKWDAEGFLFSLSGSPASLVFYCQEWLMGHDPVQAKFKCKEVDLLWKQPSCTHLAS